MTETRPCPHCGERQYAFVERRILRGTRVVWLCERCDQWDARIQMQSERLRRAATYL